MMMMTMTSKRQDKRRAGARTTVAAMLAAAAGLLLTGCAGFQSGVPAPTVASQFKISGTVFGGQQPVAQSQILVYAASTAGYNTVNPNLLTTPVFTASDGTFNVTGDYTCTAGQQIYIVSTGGNPGNGTNSNLALMSAIGDCSTAASQFVNVDEVSTVASVFALAPFMTSVTNVSTSPTNTSGLVHAFTSVRKLANLSNGTSPGTALPAGATAPSATINTLANIIAACVNSTGVSGNATGSCTQLFGLSTPASGAAPTDTIQALLNIAHNPTLNVSQLFNMATPVGPFQPTISPASLPNDWTLAVTYSGAGLNSPRSTTVDAAGNIWVANAAANTVTVLAQNGTPLANSPFSGNGLASPTVIAIDTTGNAWVANTAGSSVSVFTSSGSVLLGSPFNGGATISAPNAIAIDAPGNVWITNSTGGIVTELTSAGTSVQQVSTGSGALTALAINPY